VEGNKLLAGGNRLPSKTREAGTFSKNPGPSRFGSSAIEYAGLLDPVFVLWAWTPGTGPIATVVRISGSAYRRPGAKFLVERDGRTTGGVSGGCLEADVRAHALQLIDGGDPRLLHYETGPNEETVWGLGLGCEGAVDVFVQRVETEPLARARDLLSRGSPFGLAEPFVIGHPWAAFGYHVRGGTAASCHLTLHLGRLQRD
jgi:hypothetical protein